MWIIFGDQEAASELWVYEEACCFRGLPSESELWFGIFLVLRWFGIVSSGCMWFEAFTSGGGYVV